PEKVDGTRSAAGAPPTATGRHRTAWSAGCRIRKARARAPGALASEDDVDVDVAVGPHREAVAIPVARRVTREELQHHALAALQLEPEDRANALGGEQKTARWGCGLPKRRDELFGHHLTAQSGVGRCDHVQHPPECSLGRAERSA